MRRKKGGGAVWFGEARQSMPRTGYDIQPPERIVEQFAVISPVRKDHRGVETAIHVVGVLLCEASSTTVWSIDKVGRSLHLNRLRTPDTYTSPRLMPQVPRNSHGRR